MKQYAYIRVSTKDQNVDRQLTALEPYHILKKNIYCDYQSGKDFSRPAYQKLLRKMKPGDLLIIKSIDRLGRNLGEILNQWQYITKTLRADILVIDYTVSYKNNTNAGTATVTITGKGNYSGTANKTFTIKAKSVTPVVTLSASSYTYDGKVKKPTVTVEVGTTKMAASTYTVTCGSGRKTVGKYSVKVTMKDNYTGTKTVYFTINPKSTTISSVTAASKAFTVKWNKQATQTTGYQIQYSTSKTFASGNKTVTITKNSTVLKKITSLTDKKKYYVRIRTYKTVSGTKYYSDWSATKAVTTK